MAAILPKSIFIHIPKTGGTTVRKVTEALGLRQAETGDPDEFTGAQRHHSPFEWFRGEAGNRRCFTCFRPTLDWYRSQWCHKIRNPTHGGGILAEENFRDVFGDWIRHITRIRPGNYGRHLRRMVEGCDNVLVLRTTHLMEDLHLALMELGEEFDWRLTSNLTPMNVAGVEKELAPLTDELIELIHESEGDGEYPTGIREEFDFIGERNNGLPVLRIERSQQHSRSGAACLNDSRPGSV